jgi:hypothetical protein
MDCKYFLQWYLSLFRNQNFDIIFIDFSHLIFQVTFLKTKISSFQCPEL